MSEKNDSGRVLDVRSLARLTFITEHDVRPVCATSLGWLVTLRWPTSMRTK
jgi:hypothetical protein